MHRCAIPTAFSPASPVLSRRHTAALHPSLSTRRRRSVTFAANRVTQRISSSAQRQNEPHPPASHSSQSAKLSSSTIRVASARAISPMRRPDADRFTEMQPLPSQRRTDLMAPKTVGFWSIIPYMAASAVMVGVAWLAKKRFAARQAALVDEFGQVIVLYGNNPDAKREIASEYKRKLGPGILRGAMFASYLATLVAEKTIAPSTIQEVSLVKKLLRVGDDKAINAINKLAATMSESPSLLGKLLFITERILNPDKVPGLELVPLFPYSASTVADLQRNMLERCYRDFVTHEIEHNGAEEVPLAAAAALRLDQAHAKLLFDGVVKERVKRLEEEAATAEAAEAEEASTLSTEDLDYPARSGEPAKAAVHAYQCSDCGYTLFPAAGREFKFYGDDFVCPACGAPKDRFVDVNAEE
ncbi:Rubredoxin-like protein [Gracilaria domingensis]|nr:Rubredoxin-like protein [Gracilaria domingensis]